jgi:prenyl protein peptidase
MGLPRFWGRVTSADTVMGPEMGEGKQDGNEIRRLGVIWTILYYVLLIVGALAWRKLLWPLTESESTLTKF